MKKKYMLAALAFRLSLSAKVMAQVPSYAPANGLVSWWSFSGNANDESGNGNNGTVNGATLTTDRNGNPNNAYSFNGNSFISMGFSSMLLSLSNFSYSCWVSTESSNSNQIVIGNYDGNFNGNIVYFQQQDQQLRIHNGSSLIGVVSNSIISQNLWYHLTVTKDNSLMKIYINGSLLNTTNISSFNYSVNNSKPFTIGKASWFNSGYFIGKIDDIGTWNRALTECEILDLFNAQLGSFSNSSVSINPTLSSIGSNATLTFTTPLQNLQWQSNPGNMGWNNILNNNTYSGSNNDTLVVSNLQLSNHNQPFRVLACGDTSNIATIQIADTCISNISVYDTTYVTINDTLLTTVTDTLIINTTLSLPAPNNENSILIYPNPASDHITIDNGNYTAMSGYSIKITNNAGQQVFQSAINQAQFYVDLSTWTGDGLYFVHLLDAQNNTVTVRKIVLQ